MGIFTPTPQNLKLWSNLGLIFSMVQTACIASQYSQTHSQGILVCLVVSAIATFAYLTYRAKVLRPGSQPATLTRAKYFLVTHLVLATWYFWMALITYLFHTSGVAVWVALTDDNAGNDLRPPDRRLIIALLSLTAASVVGDAYAVLAHTRRLAAVNAGTVAHDDAEKRRDRPRFAATQTVLIDIALIVTTIIAYTVARDHGLWVLLALVIFSLICNAWYAYNAWTRIFADVEWHIVSQLLLMQHLLIVSTVFLVTLLVLLLHSIGLTLPNVVAHGTRGQAAQSIISIGAYFFMGITTIVLVNLHTQIESPAHAHDFDAATTVYNVVDTGYANYQAPTLVPVTLPREPSGPSMYGPGSMVTPVPLV